MILVKRIITGKLEENCYIVYENKNSFIIDPGSDPNLIIGFIESKNLKVLAILNTHGHYDHIGAVKELKDKFKIPFFLYWEDQELLKHANLYFMFFKGAKFIQIPKVDYYFDKIRLPVKLENFSIKVLFTPGHTRGSVCFQIGNYIFTGDTLLKRKIGEIDKINGDKKMMEKSLREISKLSPETIIYPGHGEITMLSDELKYNNEFKKIINEGKYEEQTEIS